MKLHPNAALTPVQRRRMCRRIQDGQSIAGAAEDFNTSRQTATKWWRRWQDGDKQLHDRTSAPGAVPHRTAREVEDEVVELRRTHGWGPDRLSSHTGVPSTTCWRIIHRRDCTGPSPRAHVSSRSTNRYEAIAPGELVHVDVAKFARIPAGGGHRMLGRQDGKANSRSDPDAGGYDFLHAAVDDHSRLAYAELLDAEDADACVGFWRRANTFFEANGIQVKRLLTDNALVYTNAHAFADVLEETGVDDHWTIQPYRPRTNGKVERFNRTCKEEFAYAYFWDDNQTRRDALPTWLHWFNHHRDHTSLHRRPPMSRVNNQAVCDN